MVKRLDPLYAKGKDWFGQVLGKDHLSVRFASTEQETFAYPVFSGLRAYFNKMLIKALPISLMNSCLPVHGNILQGALKVRISRLAALK